VIGWSAHLIILPVVIPMIAGAAMLLMDDSRRIWRARLGVLAVLAQLAAALALLARADAAGGTAGVYLLGDWAAPFGIVLVADRLAAMMLVLAAVLGLAALVYAQARWDRAGVHFHTLFQFQLMGLNGAFLTGDLFNLFVCFEILLAASYGLLLHGSGTPRVKAGLHYIAVNLVASFLFLIGASLIYGAVGTLNMADLAGRMAGLAGQDKVLLQVGAGVLGCAFLIKAAAWPLNFWLPAAYASAAAPVAALFAIMTKVGVYAVLRMGTLLAAADPGSGGVYGAPWIFAVGLVTLALGAAGLLASQELRRQAAWSVLVSSGTLLAAVGYAQAEVLASALYYLLVSTLAIAAFFLLIEIVESQSPAGASVLALTLEAFGLEDAPAGPDQPDEVVGVTIPAAMAILGVAFVACALLITGLPPLSGFVAKFGMLAGALRGAGPGTPISGSAWLLLAVVLGSGLAGMIALVRSGIRTFWAVERGAVRLRPVEALPMLGLLGLCVAMTAAGEPLMRYLDATARALHAPQGYVEAVMSQPAQRPAGQEDAR